MLTITGNAAKLHREDDIRDGNVFLVAFLSTSQFLNMVFEEDNEDHLMTHDLICIMFLDTTEEFVSQRYV